ncbi:hypothetical protein JOY44_05525 [Phormidium sp. CLA17]|uniref:hypothetical protein n=1 Tax=Leptolyngbya sp. Cla-17 TaxID=2803751 RepID=UPI0014926F40|nr:hypothetical protein [Leptolyngbya sp. Cla-17]MBM0741081.1 hypothetical protein [Leptolyngbya sp. Cla-17]
MTRSWDYPGRKHQAVIPATANGQIAPGKMLKPMKSKNDEQVPALGRPEKPPIPYDVHTNGPLTYFQFYLDEVVQSANAAESAEKQQSISTTVLLGAGLVAATVVSGLLIGDALNKPTAPPDTKTPPLKPKQRAKVSVLRPVSAAPEKLEAQRSQPQAIPQSVSAPRVSPRQNSVNQTTPQSFAPMLPSVTLATVPETLTVSRSLPAKRTVTSAPPPAGMKPLTRPAYQDLPNLQRPPLPPITASNALPVSAIRETIPTGIAVPESINSEPSGATSTLGNPSQPSSTVANPVSLPREQPNAEFSPITPPRVENELAAPKPSVPEPATPAAEPSQLNSTPSAIESNNAIESEVPNSATKSAALTDRWSAIASSSSNSSTQPVGSPGRLQDFVALAQRAPVAKPMTLMPLTQQAAEEAGQYRQLEKFAIRQVAFQDYQKEWSASSKSSDSAGYPAYGFIDYQRQVIVVLTEQPQANPVQSQKVTLPNS